MARRSDDYFFGRILGSLDALFDRMDALFNRTFAANKKPTTFRSKVTLNNQQYRRLLQGAELEYTIGNTKVVFVLPEQVRNAVERTL